VHAAVFKNNGTQMLPFSHLEWYDTGEPSGNSIARTFFAPLQAGDILRFGLMRNTTGTLGAGNVLFTAKKIAD
jgi:hypothetical protein